MLKFDGSQINKKARARRAALLLCVIALILGIMSFFAYRNLQVQTISPQPIIVSSSPEVIIGESGTSVPMSVSTPPLALAPVIIPKSPLKNEFGLSVGETLLPLDATDLNNRLNDMAELGIGWIRFDMQWDHVQPYNGNSYNWSDIDRVVAAANLHHIKILAILDYTPSWDRPAGCPQNDDKCLPADPTDFDNFVSAAVTRYAPEGVSDWEIWNEPNLSAAMQPDDNVENYVNLLESAYTTIKTIQPNSMVIVGGLGPAATQNGDISPLDFLSEMYADGAEPYFDAIGFHPYSYPAMPLDFYNWNAWSQMNSTSPSLRSIMIANGDVDKRIWVTEYGAPTNGPGAVESSATDTVFAGGPDHVTELLQAQMIAQAMSAIQNDTWAGPLFIYSYRDLGTSTSTIQNFFGIIRSDGSTKPAYSAIKTLMQ